VTSRTSWDVELTAGDDVKTDTCLYLPPNALQGVDLPKRLLVRVSDGTPVLVGSSRIDGGDDESVIRVSSALLTELAPDRDGLRLTATVERASWGDLYSYTEREAVIKIVLAILVAVAAIIGAVIAFLASTSGTTITAVVLVLAAAVALLTARSDIRDAVAPKC
jgi:hypothetical protein